jgi:hypothetical protein
MNREEKLRVAKQRFKQYQYQRKTTAGSPKTTKVTPRNHSISSNNGIDDKKSVQDDNVVIKRSAEKSNINNNTNILHDNINSSGNSSINEYQKLLFEKTEQFNLINNQLNEKINEIQQLNELLKNKEAYISSQQNELKKMEINFQENSKKIRRIKK